MALFETAISSLPHNEVIEDPDIEALSGSDDRAGQSLVLFRGFGVTARMVMDKDQGTGMVQKGSFNDSSWVDKGAIHGPFVDDFVMENLVLCVEIDHHEGLMGQARELGLRVVDYRLRGAEKILLFHLLRPMSARKFPYQPNEDRPHRADAGNRPELGETGVEDSREGPEATEEGLGDRFDVLARKGIGQEKLQKLVIVKALCPRPFKSLSKALPVAKVMGFFHGRIHLNIRSVEDRDLLCPHLNSEPLLRSRIFLS